jgi:transposase
MLLVDAKGIPLAIDIEGANRNEIRLIEPLLEKCVIGKRKIQRLIYDKAADGNALRERLHAHGIDLICPHRRKRKRHPLQDGRKLRRYRRRWTVERTIAWLHNFRRVVTRWEYHDHLFAGFVQLACLVIILKRF